jgi:hypothetical protein
MRASMARFERGGNTTHVTAISHLCESDEALDTWRGICRFELILRGRRG